MTKLIKDVTFDHKEAEDDCGAHLAYTFAFQGGASSGYNKPVLLKSKGGLKINQQIIKAVRDLGEDVTNITKAYNSQIRRDLANALEEKNFDSTSWSWQWLEDFDESNLIFSSDCGLYSVGYTVTDEGVVSIGDVAQPALSIVDYKVVEGEVLVSEDFYENVLVSQQLMKSVLQNEKTVSKLIKLSKSVVKQVENTETLEVSNIVEGEPQMSQEQTTTLDIQALLKSAEASEIIKSLVAEATKAKDEEINILKAAEAGRVEKAHRDVIKSFSFVEEDKVELIVKSFVANPEVAVLMVEVLEKAKEQVEKAKAEFSVEVGVDVTQKPASDANEIIKAKAKAIADAKNK